jgi:hypothetical protein
MNFSEIPENHSLVLQLKTIYVLMTGIRTIEFSQSDNDDEYIAAIHFDGILFYDTVHIKKAIICDAKDDLSIAVECLRLLEVKDTDTVLIAAGLRAKKELESLGY